MSQGMSKSSVSRQYAWTRIRSSNWRFVVLGLLAVPIPFLVNDYTNSQLATVFAMGIAVLGLNLLTGYTGLISIGHGALMGVGGYATVVLAQRFDVPYLLAVVLAGCLGFLVGLALGIPSLRIKGMYLALVTVGLALIFPEILIRWSDLTGGSLGIIFLPPKAPEGVPLTSAQWLYLLTLIALVLAMVVANNLIRGRLGRSIKAVRINEMMAAANGISVSRTKVTVFAISSSLAAIGGAFYQLVIGPAVPEVYMIILSIGILTGAVVGGVRSILGSVIGAAFVVYAPRLAADVSDRAPGLPYAIALLLAVFFFRDGVMGSLERLANYVKDRRTPQSNDVNVDHRPLVDQEKSER